MMVRCWLDVTEIWRIAFTRHMSYKLIVKLIVNVNVSKTAFAQKKTSKTESRGRHIRQKLPTFPAITRLRFRLAPRSRKELRSSCSIKTAAANEGCRSQNQYINDKHLLQCTVIQKAHSEWGDLGTSVYNWTIKGRKCRYLSLDLCSLILAALTERLSESSKFVALPKFISEKVCSTNKPMH